jgi:hypothetical protein
VQAADDPTSLSGKLKAIGGSKLANQTLRTLWVTHSKDEARDRQYSATLAALVGIGPKDELEGMLAAQLVAAHNAAMECYRRAMFPEQTFEGRHENLNQANKLSRTYTTLLEAFNRHRGKGAQKVTVEHVHVHEGGQAIVGNVEAPAGGGVSPQSKDQPHALAYAPGTAMPSAVTAREPVQSPAMKNGRCRMHGGPSPGAPKGNKNVFQNGRYTADAIARRRHIADLIRSARAVARLA